MPSRPRPRRGRGLFAAATAHLLRSPAAASVSLGRGFAPFGTDEPTGPRDLPDAERSADSWSARVTLPPSPRTC